MKKIFLLIAFSSLCFIGCKKDKTEDPPAPVGTNVYMCGYSFNAAANVRYACYWKNGTIVPLTSNTTQGNDPSAQDMAVVGNDIYIVGGEKNSSGIYVAKYWKNGVVTNITDGTRIGYAYAIEVKGSDVYIAFNEINGVGKEVIKLWKNGVITSITDGSNIANCSGIAVSGSDVYIVGSENNGSINIPKYWKNGVAVNIPVTNVQNTFFQDIAVSGNDVYVVGTEYTPLKTAVIYKNGTPVWLTAAGIPRTELGGLVINGTDIYVGGTIPNALSGYFVATYWKNGTSVSLTDGTTDAVVRDMFVFNSDVYATGLVIGSGGFGIATWWKNGTLNTVGNTTESSTALSIIVQ
ncbi:MAG: hypothetical protein IPH34_06345 [Chitinophagaceae bacterium]|nr:hypothetical protein [Chitinophagaceae bacterium]MBP6477608.1 hypothetical protein [Chitinophagaceae bacterium]MBP7107114.1 hypothetical protein [Chitinophagaceae bacterium]MBP7314887.1 hypothetical protein [Chitinophagaceae bacterium]HQV54535.1 hypothetical protein [Chitinophagaceae bacterium]